MNLYEKILTVSQMVKNIEKNMTVGKGNSAYKAVSDIDVTLSVKDAEAEVGLVSIPIKQELVKTDIIKVQNDNGGESIKYVDIVKMTVVIINIENTEERIEVESFGRGLDSADKGFGKASTYARKYALLNAYKIATGEDPDADPSKPTKAVNEPSVQRVAVSNVLLQDGIYCASVLQWAKVERIEDIPEDKIKGLYETLKKRGKV